MSTRRTLIDFSSLNGSLERAAERVQEAVQEAAADIAPADDLERARLMAAFNNAIGKLKEENKEPGVMSSAENGLAARIQTYLVEQALQNPGVKGDIVPVASNADEVKFDNHDVLGWLPTGLRLIFRAKPFGWRQPIPTAEAIGDKARVALFSDWGTGLYGAPAIADSIKKEEPGFQLIMHLGDIYYSGAKREVQERFSDIFPEASGALCRALNGNHEMYSGGTAYIEAVDTRFGQKSSCVAWQNAHWLLVGLDTAYVDHNMSDDQVRWLTGLVNAAGNRKVILFSHHQPFSQLDSQGPRLRDQLAPLLTKQRIHAWYWGHEHRCVIYDAEPVWGLKGRCIGHGGFPAFRDKFATPGGSTPEWKRLATAQKNGTTVPGCEVLDGPNPFIEDRPERYSPHGYVTLEFDGAQCLEVYKDPAGKLLRPPEAL